MMKKIIFSASLALLSSCNYMSDEVVNVCNMDCQHILDIHQNKAEKGDKKAQYLVGICQDKIESYKHWIELSANQNYPDAMAELASYYVINKEYPRSLEIINKTLSIDPNHGATLFILANMYRYGTGVPKDMHKAIMLYQKSSEANYFKSQHNLALLYKFGDHVEQNLEKTFYLLSKSADYGFNESKILLGDMYYYGEHVPIDRKKAYEIYRDTALSGYIIGFSRMNYLFAHNNIKSLDIRLEADIDWLKRNCDAGCMYACGTLGTISSRYNNDTTTAINYFEKANHMGLKEAGGELGMIYYNLKSYDKAFSYFKTAADNGCPTSQYFVGYFFENGYSVAKDIDEAFVWYTISAKQGYQPAKNRLLGLRSTSNT